MNKVYSVLVLVSTAWIHADATAPLCADEPPSAVANAVAKKEQTEQPPPRTHYLGRKIAITMHYTGAPWLVRESREREEDCSALLKALKLKPGQTVCDLGCGKRFLCTENCAPGGAWGESFSASISSLKCFGCYGRRAKVAKIDNIVPVLGNALRSQTPLRAKSTSYSASMPTMNFRIRSAYCGRSENR